MKRQFSIINGFLIPGGAVGLRPGVQYYDAVNQVFELAIKANDTGDYFPILGICLGFEALGIITSGNLNLLTEFEAVETAATLSLTDKAAESRFIKGLHEENPHVRRCALSVTPEMSCLKGRCK